MSVGRRVLQQRVHWASCAAALTPVRTASATSTESPGVPQGRSFDINRERWVKRFELAKPRHVVALEQKKTAAASSTAASELELGVSLESTVRLDAISAADVSRHWPPKALLGPPTGRDALKAPGPREVVRPHIYWNPQSAMIMPEALQRGNTASSSSSSNSLATTDGAQEWWEPDVHRGLPQSVGVEDVGRLVKIERDDLIRLLPEGACGELSRDLTLIPNRDRPVGLMLRKLTVELIMQLAALRDAKDARGEYRINKAGFLIDGHKGTGKSQILNLLVMWARQNGWLVVLEPVPSRYSKEIAEIKRSNMGVYIQNEFAYQFLEAMSIFNRHMLAEIPVDMTAYGSCAIDGEPVWEAKRLYDPLIEKTVDQEMQEAEEAGGSKPWKRLERINELRQKVRLPSMAEQLQNPSTVWDIVEFALENNDYTTQAVSEVFLQLQRQTKHPVLVVVDEWNECFPVSQYVSIRYDNTRFHGYIPAYHLTMPRTLHRWDGHRYRRGLKICATSWMRFRRRDYRPELLGVKDYEMRTVRNFSQFEFANFVAYYRLMNVLHQFPVADLDYYYMITGGNGWQSRRVLTTLF